MGYASHINAALESKPESATQAAIPEEGFKALRRAIELLPGHPAPHREPGRAVGRSGGRLQEAVDAYSQAARLDPADLTIPIEAAVILADRGQREPAVRNLDGVVSRSGSGRVGGLARELRRIIATESGPVKVERAVENLNAEK